jgi:hypothetical protein
MFFLGAKGVPSYQRDGIRQKKKMARLDEVGASPTVKTL